MKKIFLTFILLSAGHLLNAETLPYIIQQTKPIYAQKDKPSYTSFEIFIPKGAYIYANPKGPGTGKPLILSSTGGKILIEKPVKYTPAFEKEFVWIYRNSVKIFIPFTVDEKVKLSLAAEGLMCTDSGSCIPFKAESSVTVLTDTKSSSQIPANSILVFYGTESNNKGLSESDIIENLKSASYNKSFNVDSKNSNVETGDTLIADLKPQILSRSTNSLFAAIFFGIIAGFLLNFMPCVLPVLSLKLISLLKFSDNRKSIISNGFSYIGGVIFSFIVLASLAVFFGFKWGSLFQQTEFTLAAAMVLFIFALSLFGVFDIGVPSFIGIKTAKAPRSQAVDSFIKGSLAAALATPCSGPFLGAVLAWSLKSPAIHVYAVFVSIGIGMSLPHILVVIRPSLISFLPKPGEWTIVFERVMGFMLVASAIYFLTLVKESLLAPSLVMLLFTAIASWQYGRWGNLLMPKRTRIFSFILMFLIAMAGLSVPIYFNYNPAVEAERESFSMQTLKNNSNNGIISVVEFTADWCPNCKLVEKTVLKTDKVRRLLESKNARFVVADISRPNTEGEKLLRSLGSQSIPFLAIFPPGKKFNEPVCLRDLYTFSDLSEALTLAAQK